MEPVVDLPISGCLPPRYSIRRILSRTERSTTLEAFDGGLRRDNAVLKVGRLADESDPGVEASFRRFCGALSSLQSEYLAVPYTYGTVCPAPGGVLGYMVRPFISGAPLSDFPLPIAEEAALIATVQVCHALDALHAKRIFHCDLKPENVIVRHAPGGRIDSRSQCVLIDISYRTEVNAHALTEVTLQYVAPELLEGRSPDRRTDLYAVGVMAYRLLTGMLPFVGDSLPELIQKQRVREFVPLASLRGDVSRGLCEAVARLLEPNPDNRPQSVQALLALLAEGSTIAPPPGPQLMRRFVGREAELADCVAALELERPSAGVGSIEISGERGSGVTAFLRELQDRLEARGVTVLTATPRAAGGTGLQTQLGQGAHALARRPHPSPVGADRIRAPETPTDLLDDLFVATHDRRVVLFVDDWRSADVAEIHFLKRLIAQDRAAIDCMPGRSGRCQVVVGGTSGQGGLEVAGDLAQVIAKRVRLRGLTREDVGELLPGDGVVPRSVVARVHALSGGSPGLVRGIVDHVVSSGVTWTDGALAPILDVALRDTADAREREIATLRSDPHGEPLLALALWGDHLDLERWRAVLSALGGIPSSRMDVDEIDRPGRSCVRSRHRHLSEAIARHLQPAEHERIVQAILAATSDLWRSSDSRDLVTLLRFAARLDKLPSRCRWRICRALIVLLERGLFADVESVSASMSALEGAPWWAELFREAARASSSGAHANAVANVDAQSDRAPEFFRDWIRARAMLRARYRAEALKVLERLSRSTLPVARVVSFALMEDHALAAADAGALEQARAIMVEMFRLAREPMSLVRRRRDKCTPLTTRVRLRACRQIARYRRIRSRVHLLRGCVSRALAACRRECLLNRATGNMLREASCLNNEGILLVRSHAARSSIVALERCVRLREDLDDEHGLVIALTNLAGALSEDGHLGAAASALNRARIVATRNGLTRQRNSALLNLALAYGRRGQLRDSQRVLRQFRRLVHRHDDAEAHALGLFAGGLAAVDRWHPLLAERFAFLLEDVQNSSRSCPREANGDLVRAELAYRSRDWAHLHTLVARMCNRGIDRKLTVVYAARVAVEAGDAVKRDRAVESGCPAGARLRLILMRRRGKRPSVASTARFATLARRRASVRQAVEWIIASLGQHDVDVDATIDAGLKALSWFEFREGHDDLQVELRAGLAGALRARGRHAEAWKLIEEALLRFRRLERKLRRWSRGVHALLHLQECLQVALKGAATSRAAEGQEMSSALCAQAFDVLMENRRNNVANRELHTGALVRLGAALGGGNDGDALVDEVLAVALGMTGAQRAVLVTGTTESHSVRRTLFADGDTSTSLTLNISWAVVIQVLGSGESSIFSDALTSEELASHRSIATFKLRSLACVPLRIGGQTLGVLYLDHHGIAGLITPEMLGFLELLAGLIAINLHMAQARDDASRAKRELVEAHRHIMRAERNRVAGELAGGLVHDLKNVLAAVSGRAQLLRRVNQDAQVLRSLDAIEKAAGTGVGLLQRLQECARDHSSQTEEVVDLVTVALEALELLAPRLQKGGVSAEVKECAGLQAWGTAGEYREMFLNLFVNACEAMPEGGRLCIAFSLDQELRKIEIVVRDTGVGMPEETRDRIFEPFFTTKGSGGTGLGLVVVRTVVVRRGGTISVESEPGSGTSFKLKLPACS